MGVEGLGFVPVLDRDGAKEEGKGSGAGRGIEDLQGLCGDGREAWAGKYWLRNDGEEKG